MARIGNRFVQAPSHGGGFRAGQPRLVVAHSLECDAKEGLAWGLVGYAASAGVSPHTATDPGETVGWCDTNLVGWHCGNGNQQSVGAEVTGRAAWTRDTWLTGNPNKALERQAKAIAELGLAIGFGPGDFRWLSLAEVGDGRTRGCCYHYDISRTLGGTDHWDPGTGYPADVQMTRIRWYAGAQGHWGLDPATRPDDAIVIGGGTGAPSGTGADPHNSIPWRDDMFTMYSGEGGNSPEAIVIGQVAFPLTGGTKLTERNGVPFLTFDKRADFDAVWKELNYIDGRGGITERLRAGVKSPN